MKYKMYDEMMEQPDSLRRTFESEMSTMQEVSKSISDVDKVYLIGCGSSISTCYSVRDAIRMSSTNLNIEVYTGYEFYYNKKLVDKSPENRQLGVATYLIDKLALRVGNEKGEDEADTVGCCTLRVEHINFEDNNTITFDFLAKDSMRYLNTVKIEPIVYENLKRFVKGKNPNDDLFDLINAQRLNDYLKQLMDGLSAKVFRTYNASFVLQQQLNKKNFNINDDINEKVNYYNAANKDVAVMCNHQRTVPKNYEAKSEQMQKDLEEHQKYLEELRDYVKNFKKSKNKYKDSKNDFVKKVFPQTKEKAEILLKNLEEKVKKKSLKLKDRESNKQVALGTSKLNYMDPRITVSWCKKNEVNIEKLFSKSTRDKFPWAMYTGPDYKF